MKHQWLFWVCCVFCSVARAQEFAIDKVYHPYVLPFEREFEYRFTSRQTDDRNVLNQRIAYGQALSENLSLEAYIVAERDQFDDFRVSAYEAELRWMITEQGQYWVDWGALFEVERRTIDNVWEFRAGLLNEKEFGRFSLTTNFLLEYERGDLIKDEIESEFRLQYRYRYLPQVQPAVEFYAAEGFAGLGPAFVGLHRFDGQKQLKWEFAFITAIDSRKEAGKDHSLRFAIEYEF